MQTAPTGSFGASPYGLHDIHGNVHEWVEDCARFEDSVKIKNERPRLEGRCSLRGARGGSWNNRPIALAASNAHRILADHRLRILGFRVARTLAEDGTKSITALRRHAPPVDPPTGASNAEDRDGPASDEGQSVTDEPEDMASLLRAMDKAERAARKRDRDEKAWFMSLGRMFPDPKLRALAKAAGRGQIRKIDRLLAQGVDINARGRNDTTALFWSFRKGNLPGFTRLLEHGADPNVGYNERNSTVMHDAAELEDTSFLEVALRHGGDPNVKAVNHWSRTYGRVWRTPIFDADTIEAVRMLVAAGADVDHVQENGRTPGLWASLFRPDLTYEILTLGADPTRRRETWPDGETLIESITEHCAEVNSGEAIFSGRRTVREQKAQRHLEYCAKIADWWAHRANER